LHNFESLKLLFGSFLYPRIIEKFKFCCVAPILDTAQFIAASRNQFLETTRNGAASKNRFIEMAGNRAASKNSDHFLIGLEGHYRDGWKLSYL
jgi:hypothetical protein